ncbi:SRPBCC family protein [Amycolatopsis palatopharyngis]|uniref:SRPBCC family protein n=1 Tax=Amycolatopsis palatopharyngis TaxID=187982 RepID=UPI000E2309B7|nr:SRPBCC family protein [Amycolatopsis palatopharyngis]
MATVRSHTRINRPAEDVWNVVSDAGNIAAWFPAIKTSSASESARNCELADGTRLTEDIVSNDPELRRFQYRITGGVPAEDHLGTVDVLADGGESMVVYTTEVRPDAIADTLGPVIEEGLQGLKQYCESR